MYGFDLLMVGAHGLEPWTRGVISSRVQSCIGGSQGSKLSFPDPRNRHVPAGLAYHFPPKPQPVEMEIDNRRGVQRERLTDEQSADNGYAERLPEFGAIARVKRQRQGAEERGKGRHHDRPEAQKTGAMDRVLRRQAFAALRIDRDIDHHDGVLLDDPNQEDDADERDDGEFGAAHHQSEERPGPSRGQC